MTETTALERTLNKISKPLDETIYPSHCVSFSSLLISIERQKDFLRTSSFTGPTFVKLLIASLLILLVFKPGYSSVPAAFLLLSFLVHIHMKKKARLVVSLEEILTHPDLNFIKKQNLSHRLYLINKLFNLF